MLRVCAAVLARPGVRHGARATPRAGVRGLGGIAGCVDLRSDTVTVPSLAMREAMQRAEVGDDVMGEDPTVNRLEAGGAEALGMEAGLFTPTGTMANLIGLAVHCRRGDGILCGADSHIYNYEAGGTSVLTSAVMLPLPNRADGSIDLGLVADAVAPDDPHFVPSRVLALENTHNICGGRVLGPDYMAAAREACDALGLILHVDGARLGNAAAALNLPLSALTQGVDSVTLCLSKGLGAPAGSLLAGPAPYIKEARRLRKMLGGGMRQVGILAAGGLMALESVPRLAADHRLAQRLVEGLRGMPGITVPIPAETNLVIFEVDQAGVDLRRFVAEAEGRGVLLAASRYSKRAIRVVTHNGLDDVAIDRALAAMAEALAASQQDEALTRAAA